MDSDIDSDSGNSGFQELEAESQEFVSEEPDPNAPEEVFDTDLPAEHTYLGDLERVSGVQWLEPYKEYRLPIFFHDSVIFPGETLPMILTQQMFLTTDFSDDGLLFGLVFHDIRNNVNYNLYGVTCQIFEKSNDGGESISIKSRAYQRFFMKNDIPDFLVSGRSRYAQCTILPEIVLSHPVYGYNTNSLSKFRKNENIKAKLLRFESESLPYPKFIFNIYDTERIINKIKKFLSSLKIETGQMDLISLSFWFSQNAVLSPENRRKAFLTNNVLSRLIFIEHSLNEDKYIVCKRCRTKITHYNKLFAMSKQGVQTSFCNSAGFIHETHTVTDVLPGVVIVNGPLSSEFCWFPGYVYRYVHCKQCSGHLGWKYFGSKTNLVPKSFLGLSGKCINVENITDSRYEYEL